MSQEVGAQHAERAQRATEGEAARRLDQTLRAHEAAYAEGGFVLRALSEEAHTLLGGGGAVAKGVCDADIDYIYIIYTCFAS
jgi:hypothetical protein